MLKITGIELELISDIETYLFIEKRKKGKKEKRIFLILIKEIVKQIINT